MFLICLCNIFSNGGRERASALRFTGRRPDDVRSQRTREKPGTDEFHSAASAPGCKQDKDSWTARLFSTIRNSLTIKAGAVLTVVMSDFSSRGFFVHHRSRLRANVPVALCCLATRWFGSASRSCRQLSEAQKSVKNLSYSTEWSLPPSSPAANAFLS